MLIEIIEALKNDIINYSYHIELMIKDSIKALKNNDVKLLNEIINKREDKANKIELKIEKQGISALAQFSPRAHNLRMLIMILKINNDLERMADNCVRICHSIKEINKTPNINLFANDIIDISKIVVDMLERCINSFMKEDHLLAKNVCLRDYKVNTMRDTKKKKLIKLFKSDKLSIDCSIEAIKILDRFERIADLSTNIAENVVYITKGKVIKHR